MNEKMKALLEILKKVDDLVNIEAALLYKGKFGTMASGKLGDTMVYTKTVHAGVDQLGDTSVDACLRVVKKKYVPLIKGILSRGSPYVFNEDHFVDNRKWPSFHYVNVDSVNWLQS